MIELAPLPSVVTKSPTPPRTTHPPARLYQNASVGVTAVLPASGCPPVGVRIVKSKVTEKSCVSCSKTRGVNETSPNVVWLRVAVVEFPSGSMVGNPPDTLLRIVKGILVINIRRRLNGV